MILRAYGTKAGAQVPRSAMMGTDALRGEALDQRSCTIDPDRIADEVYDAISEISCTLREDFRRAIDDVIADRSTLDTSDELTSRASDVLACIAENDDIGRSDHVPICQDTGTVWVCLEIGPDIACKGDAFSKVNAAVARAYKDNALRMSVVSDALLDRSNTGDNTPAFCEVKFRDRPGATLHVMLKGGGSDNASRVVMLAPGAGRAGIVEEVLACVREKAANACPPLVIGIGIGSTFDKVAGLAKQALLRPVGSKANDAELRAFEEELKARIDALNIGPGALGGCPTALAVHINTAPCHIAALPLAINMGCCAMRSKTIDLM